MGTVQDGDLPWYENKTNTKNIFREPFHKPSNLRILEPWPDGLYTSFPKDPKDPPMEGWTNLFFAGVYGPQNDASFEGPMILRVVQKFESKFFVSFAAPEKYTSPAHDLWTAEVHVLDSTPVVTCSVGVLVCLNGTLGPRRATWSNTVSSKTSGMLGLSAWLPSPRHLKFCSSGEVGAWFLYVFMATLRSPGLKVKLLVDYM